MELPPRPRTSTRGEKGHGTDERLQQVACGEIEAFDAVYDHLAPSVYGLVLRVVRDSSQAEEVVQEVMLELWACSTRFDADLGTARTWALTIAHRRAVDRVRAERSHSARQERAARELGPLTYQRSVPQTIEDHWDEQRLHCCIAALTELQREAVLLAFFDGMTYREVAEALDTPLSTVKTRIRDGLSRLRACLEANP